ncbi:MAG: M23 family metallopeptidase [Candidatus Shapirobacteria bacterium]
MKALIAELKEFYQAYLGFFFGWGKSAFWRLDKGKKFFSGLLYRQRGRFAQPLSHLWLGFLLLLGIFLSPLIEEKLRGEAMGWQEAAESLEVMGQGDYLSSADYVSAGIRGEVVEYVVKLGDTISSIAQKYDISVDTVLWANNLTSSAKIKEGQRLNIPPVTGIIHEVKRGETVYSLAEKYQISAQNIVNYPFNSFSNDETFALRTGQTLIIPDGVMPAATPRPIAVSQTVQAGSFSGAKGTFVWPTSGRITQNFVWYHPGTDIANKSGPVVVAADAGQVVSVIYARYDYGNHVVLDHGNGYRTLYAHLSSISVSAGQTVSQGQQIGIMGSTGRSTGVHLHFEVIKNGVKINPLSVLQ